MSRDDQDGLCGESNKRILYDTANGALADLRQRQVEAIKRAERGVEKAREKLTLVEHYDTILEGKL
jgi:hypothetical protein